MITLIPKTTDSSQTVFRLRNNVQYSEAFELEAPLFSIDPLKALNELEPIDKERYKVFVRKIEESGEKHSYYSVMVGRTDSENSLPPADLRDMLTLEAALKYIESLGIDSTLFGYKDYKSTNDEDVYSLSSKNEKIKYGGFAVGRISQSLLTGVDLPKIENIAIDTIPQFELTRDHPSDSSKPMGRIKYVVDSKTSNGFYIGHIHPSQSAEDITSFVLYPENEDALTKSTYSSEKLLSYAIFKMMPADKIPLSYIKNTTTNGRVFSTIGENNTKLFITSSVTRVTVRFGNKK